MHLRVADVDLNRGILTVRQGKLGKDRLVPPAYRRCYACKSTPLASRPVHPMLSSFLHTLVDPGRFERSITYSGSCCSSAAFRMPLEARDRASTTFATPLLSIAFCVGIVRAQTSMPSCQCWRPTWDISRSPARSAICI